MQLSHKDSDLSIITMILGLKVNNTASRGTSALEKLEIVSFLGMVFFVLIPVRYLFTGLSETTLGYFSDFTTISLYFSMLFSFLYIGLNIYKDLSRGETALLLKLLLGLILIGGLYIITNQLAEQVLHGYAFLKISCALLVGYYVYKSQIWLKYGKYILWIIVSLGVINSIVAIGQFMIQSSIGLNFLGESPISILSYDIAKTVAHETVYIRAYGLFPHPNILSAVLATISILNLFLLTKSTQIPRFLLWFSFCILTTGLFLTFSRAGLLAFSLGFITWQIFNFTHLPTKSWKLLLIPIIWLSILSIIFYPWLSQRVTWSDQAVIERGVLNSAGMDIIREHWLLGTGPGSNLTVLHGKLSEQYNDWEIQPIHNYFLITISELGVIGLSGLIFILYFFYKIFKISLPSSKTTAVDKSWIITLSSISIIIFSLFWFDHYFYTNWSAQLLLAIIIGQIANQSRSNIQEVG